MSNGKIAIVDYNMGNLGSVFNAFVKVGASAELVSDPDKLINYDRVTLPGVGAFPDAMDHLHSNGMSDAIKEYSKSDRPLMGTCLGMQLLFDSSEEFGYSKGLGLIPGKVVAFDESKFDHKLKVPHMGWNEMFCRGLTSNDLLQGNESFAGLTPTKSNDLLQGNESFAGLTPTKLFDGLPDDFYLYFVHSFHAVCDDRYAIGKTYYGYDFVSAVQNENIYGFQPHPEKSHDMGLKIIENFTKL
ncbi:MAG: imidazole glycerol phosphate synthase subunit HisH [Sulfurovum sp.]|nr:imidazole glycerol phosphate synthase subunit HisH [Sulfurovum sp.]